MERFGAKWKLTEQAQDFFIELAEALKLPTEYTSYHTWLAESIEEFKKPNSVIQDYKKEVRRILEVLGKYAVVERTKVKSTANTFYELFKKLFILFGDNEFIKNHEVIN